MQVIAIHFHNVWYGMPMQCCMLLNEYLDVSVYRNSQSLMYRAPEIMFVASGSSFSYDQGSLLILALMISVKSLMDTGVGGWCIADG
jgi:hypothetical protein